MWDISNSFDETQKAVVNQIAEICICNNIKAYIVGGAVRDAILKIRPNDIDICFEDDFTQIIDKIKPKKVVFHEAFQTAVIQFENGISVDFIRCRKEKYYRYGELPAIIPSNIYEDLKRRDFTVNAIAYCLNEKKIVDPFDGINDIKNGILKKVHENSYAEDPTRIFRAVKYSARYGFEIADMDEIIKCLDEKVIETISIERILNEILSLCSETKWVTAFHKCMELNIFDFSEKILGIENPLVDYSDSNVRFLNIIYCLKSNETALKLANASNIKTDIRKAIKSFIAGNIEKSLLDATDNYDIYNALKKSNNYEVIILSFNVKLLYKLINFKNNLSSCSLKINGEYIKTSGIQEGKAIGLIIEYIRRLKLNTGLKDEKKYFDENMGEIMNAIKH